jgi:hypothetical protein
LLVPDATDSNKQEIDEELKEKFKGFKCLTILNAGRLFGELAAIDNQPR